MISELDELSLLIGNTPVISLKHPDINLFSKLEMMNPFGSVKDRAALNVIVEAVREGRINENTTIIESSSGNMAVALAFICKKLRLTFIPVIDPNVNPQTEALLRVLCNRVIKVDLRDETGGFLLTRIQTVKDICASEKNIFWTDQYNNPNNYLGYSKTLALELFNSFANLDYIFISVSSGGTITGLSRKLREKFGNIKVVAVDVEGSVIFGGKPRKRSVTGIGSSMCPSILKNAFIDYVIMVNQLNIIDGTRKLFEDHGLFTGASTGAAYYAVNEFFQLHPPVNKPSVLFLAVDKGGSYVDTVYNHQWVEKLVGDESSLKYAVH